MDLSHCGHDKYYIAWAVLVFSNYAAGRTCEGRGAVRILDQSKRPPLVRQGSDCLVGAAVFHHWYPTILLSAGECAGSKQAYQNQSIPCSTRLDKEQKEAGKHICRLMLANSLV